MNYGYLFNLPLWLMIIALIELVYETLKDRACSDSTTEEKQDESA